MTSIAAAAAEFLACHRIAVTGVSRNPQGHGSNAVFDRLGERGYEVFPINPNAEKIAGKTAYPNLAAVPGGVEAVVIGTRPEHALATVKEAVELGITKVWMHRSLDAGSVSAGRSRLRTRARRRRHRRRLPADVRPGRGRRAQVHVRRPEAHRQGATDCLLNLG